jgi:chromosome segregation ATPase
MTQQDNEAQEQLSEALAQIESLQSAAADAEARAETVQGNLSEAIEARDAAIAEANELRGELEGARMQIREAATRYREVRLAAHPEVPADLVAEGESTEDVDRAFESAVKVVGQVRERVEEEGKDERRGARVPAGSPPRRAPDLSALPSSEKIRLGLQQLSD